MSLPHQESEKFRQDGIKAAPSLDTSKVDPSTINLTLEEYRVLVGIPQEQRRTPDLSNNTGSVAAVAAERLQPLKPDIRRSTIRSDGRTRARLSVVFGIISRPRHARRILRDQSDPELHNCDEENEFPTSLYYHLRREESEQQTKYNFYNTVNYLCLVFQLVIASALIVIGALPTAGGVGSSAHRIAIAVLGAITGVLTGLLSLMKGQGLPNRFQQYASRLRAVRNEVEGLDRVLRTGRSDLKVTYADVLKVKKDYEEVLAERDMNRPDTWATTKPQSL